MKCHRCGADPGRDRVGPRDVCDRCRAHLHCCRNCSFYEPGASNDCREPDVEPVGDKEAGNFCDFFRFGEGTSRDGEGAQARQARQRLEKLFGKR